MKYYILDQKICAYHDCDNTFHPLNKEDTTCSAICNYEHWRIVGGMVTGRVLEGKSLKHINNGPAEYSMPGLQHESSPDKIIKMINRELRSQ